MEPERLSPKSSGAERNPGGQRGGLSRPDDGGAAELRVGTHTGDTGITGATPSARRAGTPSQPEPGGSGSGKKALMALVMAVLLAVGYFLFGSNATGDNSKVLAAETQAPNYQKHKNASPGASMRLSRADLDANATQAAIAAAKSGQAIPGLASASPELTQAIARGEVEFYTVRAYDTCAEDGDWVTITTASGARMGSVMITKAGTKFTIPVVGGQQPDLSLIADKDGVGGVTVGVQTSGGTWYSGVLSEGQMQLIPVSVR